MQTSPISLLLTGGVVAPLAGRCTASPFRFVPVNVPALSLAWLWRVCVVANFTSLRPSYDGHSLRYVAPPFPTQLALLGLRGDPDGCLRIAPTKRYMQSCEPRYLYGSVIKFCNHAGQNL